MLILEGPDCTGKTTLAKRLVKRLNELGHSHVYHHLSKLPEGFDRYWGYSRLACSFVVQDRLHMSEIAYELGRGEQAGDHGLTPERYRQVDAMLRLHGSYTVVLYLVPGHAKTLLDQRWDKDEMYDKGLVLRVNEWYAELAQFHGAYEDYKMDLDASFGETPGVPFPTDQFVDEVIRQYCERLDSVWKTASLKYNTRNLCSLR